MRLSSPSLAAAFIEGATSQGADVVDYGMIADRHAVLRGRDATVSTAASQITASHNPKQYNGMKMVRQEAFPLSGDAGISRHPRHDRRRTAAAACGPARARSATKDVLDAYVEHVMSFIDPSVIRPFNVVLDAGQRHGRPRRARSCSTGCPAGRRGCASTIDGRFPNHEANPLIEENRRDIVERVVAEKADIGIAWDGDADRCFFIDGTGEFISGDFITALLAEAFLLKAPGATIIYDLRASYAVKDIVGGLWRHGADEPRRPRVHQAADARVERDLRRRGHGPLLLPRQLLRRQRVHPGAADPRADVEEGPEPARAARAAAAPAISSPARSTPSWPAWTSCRRSSTRSRAKYADGQQYDAGRHFGRVSRLALQRARRRTPSRCCG